MNFTAPTDDESVPDPDFREYLMRKRAVLTAQAPWNTSSTSPHFLACPNCGETAVHLQRIHLVFTNDYEPVDTVSYSLYASSTAADSVVDVPMDELAELHGGQNRGAMLALDISCEEEDGATHQILLRNHKAFVFADSSTWKTPTADTATARTIQQIHDDAVALFHQALATESPATADINPLDLRRRNTSRCRGTTQQGRTCQAVRLPYVGDWCWSHASLALNIADQVVSLLHDARYITNYDSMGQIEWANRKRPVLEDLRNQLERPTEVPAQAQAPPRAKKPKKRTSRTSPTTIKARFPSTCFACSGPIDEGATIQRDPVTESWNHAECPAPENDNSAAPGE